MKALVAACEFSDTYALPTQKYAQMNFWKLTYDFYLYLAFQWNSH